MRKSIIAFVTVVFMGVGTSGALACGGGAYDGGHGMGWSQGGYMTGWNHGSGYSRGYIGETATLRQELAAKRGEYDALMTHHDHDPNRAAQLSEEIASLEDQIQARAQARGYMGPGTHYGHGRW